VTFLDEPSWKDEEIYEAVFGKHWSKDSGAQSKTSRSHSRSQNIGISTGTRKKSNKCNIAGVALNVSTISSSPTSDAEVSQTSSITNKKKSVSFESSTSNSEIIAPSRDESRSLPTSSTREQRSRRRQSHLVEKVELKTSSQVPPNHKRTAVTSSRPSSDSKKARRDEEVIKIPMRTGTLYLYRGLVRRAEFIRHI
jgi:hypothetical protein